MSWIGAFIQWLEFDDESLAFPAKKPKHLSWFRLNPRFYATFMPIDLQGFLRNEQGWPAQICMSLPIRCLPSCACTLNSMRVTLVTMACAVTVQSSADVGAKCRMLTSKPAPAENQKGAGGVGRMVSIKGVHRSPACSGESVHGDFHCHQHKERALQIVNDQAKL